MRFMMIVKASEDSEAGVMPTREMIAEMGQYNDRLAEAGMMLAGDGLHPTSRGARVTYSDGPPVVTEGPFGGRAKDLIAGFWIIRAGSMDEALEWARKIPFQEGEVEVRPLFEASDFPAE
ncbi:YciI family protein [Streptomyces griseocarneus]|uniref:YciI family protein n=1 Tax=Streptomyces griseocarneus TaxID=51201 RepID=UPI00167DC7BF|nr:YciI family protein [Streptomyces griseocarneus]MBZ6473389.1 YciI family protein [Streptomyces griseocarneus]GHG57195.1 dehydrogenase [Streptomyces griseocarneus]